MMVNVKNCPTCGSTDLKLLNINNAICEHCGNSIDINNEYTEKINNLLTQGRVMLNALDFKIAKFYYEEVIKLDDKLHEAYFGAFISDYGIEYVKDPKTLKYVPTCHKTSTISVYDNVYFQKALNNADEKSKDKYLRLAKEYEIIRSSIVSMANEFENYDIFICYKSKKEDGTYTKEYDFAIDLYYELKKDKSVFFADRTLQNYLGEEYEAIIYRALSTAKLMLVVSFDLNHLNSTWVKNEWNRFLELKKHDFDKKLVLIYKDISPYDLPSELRNLQCLDVNKYNYLDSLRHIVNNQKVSLKEEQIDKPQFINYTNKGNIQNAQAFLLSRNFLTAEKFFKLAIKDNSKDGSAYFGLIMAITHSTSYDELPRNIQKLDDLNIIVKALKNSDEIKSLEYLNILISCVIEKANSLEVKDTLRLYNELIKWTQDDTSDYLSNIIYNMSLQLAQKKYKESLKVFDQSLKTISQNEMNVYYERHYNFVKVLRINKKFGAARRICKKVLRINSSYSKIVFEQLLVKHQVSDEKKLYKILKNKKDYQQLEVILKSDFNLQIINELVNSCMDGIKKNNAFQSTKLFNLIIKYIPSDYNDNKFNIIWNFANRLLKYKYYRFATLYFEEIVKLKPNFSKGHIGLVMCKYRINDIDHIDNVKVDITKDKNFINALNCNDEYSKLYTRIRKKRKFF